MKEKKARMTLETAFKVSDTIKFYLGRSYAFTIRNKIRFMMCDKKKRREDIIEYRFTEIA
jgi:hypothetical protein